MLIIAAAAVTLAVLASRQGRLFISGAPLDGVHRTDATFFQPPTRALNPRAARSWWHWRPGWHRGAIRVAVLALTVMTAGGLIVDRPATIAALASAGGVMLAWCAWRIAVGLARWSRAVAWDREHPWKSAGTALAVPWTHYWHYRRPLRYAITKELGVPPLKVKVPFDRSRATIRLPYEFTGADKTCEAVTRCVTSKLALEAPEPAWKLHGRAPRVTFTLCNPPPGALTWDDVAGEIESAAAHELISGVGRRDAIVKASLELDSPHFGESCGTGGGKSVLAAFWLLQRLRRGDIALILDAKRFSHPWAFKDMSAEYGLLPNVAYCRTTSDLHDAMEWLGTELDRRNGVTERTITADNRVLGDVGPRMWIIAEEMNLAYGPLKAHWAAIRDPERDPKKSPAFTGLGAVSYAGRAARMHLVVIGQMLRADILGGGDVRENIGVRMLARYTQNSWKMQAGDVAMPPPSRVPGRWQQLASGEVTEVQVPYVEMGRARDLAVGGAVTPCPWGMPGRSGAVSVVPAQACPMPLSDQRFVVRQADVEEVAVGLTIKEALDDGIFGPLSLEAARRRVQRARLKPSGRRGDGSHTYSRADLFTAAKGTRISA